MNYKGILTIRTEKDNEHTFIHFSDTGAGIPESIKGKIFEPFFTTKKHGEGIGLGLDICKKIIEKYGRIDVLVNNAGINRIGPFASIDPEDFLRIQQVNVFAPFLLCQAAIPAMYSRGWGRIVNISSIWGKIGKEYRGAYAASKFALRVVWDEMVSRSASRITRYPCSWSR